MVVNGNPQMIRGSGIAGAVFGCLGEGTIKKIENMRFRLGPQQAGTVRITRGSPKWESTAHTIMTDCNTQSCSKEQAEEESRLIIRNIIREAVSRGNREIHMIPMSPVIEGLIAGIIEMSQENQVTINLIVKEREQEEIKNIIKRQKDI